MFANIRAAVMAAVVALFLSACGGGGGGGDPSPAPTAVPVAAAGPTCPDGSPIPATGSSACPAILPVSTSVAQGAIVSPRSLTGINITMGGTISSAGVTLTDGSGNVIAGVASISADGKTLSFVPTVRLAFGRSFFFSATVNDTLGRIIGMSIAFSTSAMVCADSAIWSNPAVFAVLLQDCVAGIGVQAIVTPAFNTLQDNSCTLTIGSPLSAACHAYLANGTFLLAATQILVNNHTALWAVFTGLDGKGNVVALDISDNANPIVVAVSAFPSAVTSITGNPGGAFIRTADGRGAEFSVDANSVMTSVCLLGCP